MPRSPRTAPADRAPLAACSATAARPGRPLAACASALLALMLLALPGPSSASEPGLEPGRQQAPGPDTATDFTSAAIELSEAGIYCPMETLGTLDAPDTETGYVLMARGDPSPVLNSNLVPAYIGISFGVRIRLAEGQPPGQYEMVMRHPAYGPRNVTEERWPSDLTRNWGIRSFRFEYPRELATGAWSLEVHRGDRVLMRRSFTVVPPSQAPEAVDLCFSGSFIS